MAEGRQYRETAQNSVQAHWCRQMSLFQTHRERAIAEPPPYGSSLVSSSRLVVVIVIVIVSVS